MRYLHMTPAIPVLLAACGADDVVHPDPVAVVHEVMEIVVDWPRLYDDGFVPEGYDIWRDCPHPGICAGDCDVYDGHQGTKRIEFGELAFDGNWAVQGQVECWADPRYHPQVEYTLHVHGKYLGRTSNCVAIFEPIDQCPSRLQQWTAESESSQGTGCTPPS